MSAQTLERLPGPWPASARSVAISLAVIHHASVSNEPVKNTSFGRRDRHLTLVPSRTTSFITAVMRGPEPSASRPRRDLFDLLGTGVGERFHDH